MSKCPMLWGVVLLLSSCVGSQKTTRPMKPSSAQFSTAQSELILEAGPDTPMRIFKITDTSDSLLLRTPSERLEVDSTDRVLEQLVERLYATVRDSLSMGVGIAAPQVGILKNLIWVQRLDKENLPFEAYLNPVITRYSSQKQDCREGCLSIPGRMDTTRTRSYAIHIEYDRLDQQHVSERVEGFTAVIFQHEIDHLRGILYLDHLEKESKER
ncbi:peptide deformylase [Reichenbachiella sp. 5M10]|uniref:peptide deformylase n=1 Tax=Reichenbachiella sp. 5M10 TaxID=1889772 RepID=UPI000C55BA4E|nr:peptide deformylase [Reichenbachiella sp. 5M10]PIB36581.1 peptide deformylase [Reichenbachiella sp. 5M10]